MYMTFLTVAGNYEIISQITKWHGLLSQSNIKIFPCLLSPHPTLLAAEETSRSNGCDVNEDDDDPRRTAADSPDDSPRPKRIRDFSSSPNNNNNNNGRLSFESPPPFHFPPQPPATTAAQNSGVFLSDKDRILNLVTELSQQKQQRQQQRQQQQQPRTPSPNRSPEESDEEQQQDSGSSSSKRQRQQAPPPLPMTSTAIASVQAALAALQAGQMSLNQLSVQLLALGAQSPGLFQTQLAAVAARQLSQQQQQQQQQNHPPPPPLLPTTDLQVVKAALPFLLAYHYCYWSHSVSNNIFSLRLYNKLFSNSSRIFNNISKICCFSNSPAII